MSKILRVPPTKSALLALKRQVVFLEKGHDLLERKRELLTRLVYPQLEHYRSLRLQARTALGEAYHWLAIAEMRMGSQLLHQVALGAEPGLTVKILPRSNLGVEYPSVNAEVRPLQPVGLMWTDASFDESRERLAKMAVTLARLGEAESALRRLLEAQRKTQKRVNALKYNVIPRFRATIHYIESALAEEERNTQFQIRVLQKNLPP
jgi:V/A-type H+-transporting ATPase subunit D